MKHLVLVLLCALSAVAVGEGLPEFIMGEHAKDVQRWLGKHPDYRLATSEDCKCDDDLKTIRNGDEKSLTSPDPKFEPYYAVGDFDGDGNDDTAFVVVPRSFDGRFLIVVVLASGRPSVMLKIKQPYGVTGLGIYTSQSALDKPYRTKLFWGAFGSEGERVAVPLAKAPRGSGSR
jgi:hypothetical protein